MFGHTISIVQPPLTSFSWVQGKMLKGILYDKLENNIWAKNGNI